MVVLILCLWFFVLESMGWWSFCFLLLSLLWWANQEQIIPNNEVHCRIFFRNFQRWRRLSRSSGSGSDGDDLLGLLALPDAAELAERRPEPTVLGFDGRPLAPRTAPSATTATTTTTAATTTTATNEPEIQLPVNVCLDYFLTCDWKLNATKMVKFLRIKKWLKRN